MSIEFDPTKWQICALKKNIAAVEISLKIEEISSVLNVLPWMP